MPQPIQERSIDGHVIRVQRLKPRQSLKAMRRLLSLIGPALPALESLSDLAGEVESAAVPEGAIRGLVGAIDKIGDADLDWLLDTFLDGALMDGISMRAREEAGDIDDPFMLAKCAAFALEVNYSSFFDSPAVRAALGTARARLSPASTTSPPNGLSGDSGQPSAPPSTS